MAGGCGRGRTGEGRRPPGRENEEDKIACLATLHSVEHGEDPQPQPPARFLQPRRVKWAGPVQMAGQGGEPSRDSPQRSGGAGGLAGQRGQGGKPSGRDSEHEPWLPRRRTRTCVAGLAESRSFGPMVAGEAQARDFYAAGRRPSWPMRLAGRTGRFGVAMFLDFEPIVDSAAACSATCMWRGRSTGWKRRPEGSRWSLYEGLACRQCWQGGSPR